MKKILIAILCAMLLMGCACAESPVIPGPETAVSTDGSMSITLNGTSLELAFDPDPLYSIVQNGCVQASFYAYDADNKLYELYMTFPQTVQSDQSVTAESGGTVGSGIILYVSDETTDICSAATQYETGAYPEGSSYTLTFDEVAPNGSLCTFTGTASAKLVEVDRYFNPTSTVNDFSASFSFTMNLGSSASAPVPEATQPPAQDALPGPDDVPGSEIPSEPQQQYPPAAPQKLVTPADAQKI